MDKLTTEFDEAMMNVYRKGRDELGYHANYFRQMLEDHGGIETARRLLAASKISDGFATLWERGRLDITVECLVLNKRFRELFDAGQLETARRRLRECGFDPEKCEHGNR